jgi:RNA polymerase sigma-70 factor (ECF subfamily)
MTYHVCLRRLGKVADAKNDLTAPDTLDLATSSDLTPEAAIAARQASDLVTRAVDQLPAQDRFLIDLRYREGQSDVEVAEATGMNVNTVRTRLFRARQALRKLLSPVLGAHPEENAR